MIRHLAAAVVCAMVNLGGAVDVNADVGGDDGPIECIEFRRDKGATGSNPLAAASVACGSDIDHAWVLRAHDSAVAAAAVERASEYESVVSLTAPRETEWAELLARSLAFCRDHGALKVTVESVGPRPVDVRLAAESVGFQYSRVRRTDGVTSIEFYTDLYWRGTRDDKSHA